MTDLLDLLAALRDLAAQPGVELTLTVRVGGGGREAPARPANAWAAGDAPKQLDGCRQVYWPGLGAYTFSPKQAAVVQVLWDAWRDGVPCVPQDRLLRAADSDGTRVRDLFSRSPAWGALIVQGRLPGSYTLPGLPDREGGAA